MSKTMRERIAAAIWNTPVVTDQSMSCDPPTEPVGNLLARELGLTERHMRPLADAALAAMLEPTEAVNDAGTRGLCDMEDYDLDVRFYNAWQAAIDAARQEDQS
jgi:hypothetical protein